MSNWSIVPRMGEESDIKMVQRMLDDLLGWRYSGGWTAAENARYSELCALERELLNRGEAEA